MGFSPITLWTGVLDVTTDPDSVAAFALSLALPRATARDFVPPTFPMRWLADAALKSAIMSAIGDHPGGALVHLSQKLNYQRPLAMGRDYQISVVLLAGATPQTFTLSATITDADGPVGHLLGEFAIVTPSEGGR